MALRGQNFNFDFSVKNVQNTNPLTNGTTTTVRNPFQPDGVKNGRQSSPSPSSGSITDSSAFRSGQSSLATSPENDVNKNATPNIDIPFDLFSNNSVGTPKFTTNSNHTTPLFSTDLFGNSPGNNASASLFRQTNSETSPILDSFAQTLATLTQNQSPQNLSNGFTTTIPSSTSTVPLPAFSPTSIDNLFDRNDPLFNTWRDTSLSTNENENFDIFDTMFSSMSPGAFNLVDTTGLTDFITDSPVDTQPPDTTNNTNTTSDNITCPELWDKVKNHPNFDDIDIDTLCAEMKAKAKVCVLSKSSTAYC